MKRAQGRAELVDGTAAAVLVDLGPCANQWHPSGATLHHPFPMVQVSVGYDVGVWYVRRQEMEHALFVGVGIAEATGRYAENVRWRQPNAVRPTIGGREGFCGEAERLERVASESGKVVHRLIVAAWRRSQGSQVFGFVMS
jgi:hypothetical protein